MSNPKFEGIDIANAAMAVVGERSFEYYQNREDRRRGTTSVDIGNRVIVLTDEQIQVEYDKRMASR